MGSLLDRHGAVSNLLLHLHLPMDEIEALCREYHVRELSLFGSVLRHDFGDDSDVDMLVLFEPDAAIGILELAALQRKLGKLIQRNIDQWCRPAGGKLS